VLVVVLAAGFALPGPDGGINGTCWDDRDDDGLRGPGEPGVNGWTMELIDPATNAVIDTRVTSSVDLNGDGSIDPLTERGVYSFTGLEAGDYLLRQSPRANWRTTTHAERLFVMERSAPAGVKPVVMKIVERDPVTGEQLNALPLPSEYPPGEIAYGPGRIYYAQATSPSDLTLRLWQLDPDTGEVLDVDTVPLPPEASWVKYGVAYLNGKVYLLSGTDDRAVPCKLIVWNPQTDQVEDILPAPTMQADVILPGDINRDHFVGQADLDTVLARWGESVGDSDPADPSGDGLVGQADVDIVRANWGSSYAIPGGGVQSLTGAADTGELMAVTSGIQGFNQATGVVVIDPQTGALLRTIGISQPAYSVGYCDGQILAASYNVWPEQAFPYTVCLDAQTGATLGDLPADPAAYHHCDKWGFAGDGVKGIQRVTVEQGQAVIADFGSHCLLPGDSTGDHFVGQADLDQVLAKWGQNVPAGDPADLNGDGMVGQADLDMVLAHWGQSI